MLTNLVVGKVISAKATQSIRPRYFLLPFLMVTLLGASMALASDPTTSAPESETVQQLPQLVAAFNRHDVAGMVTGVSADFVWYNVTSDNTSVAAKGPAGLQEFMGGYFQAVPPARSEIDGIVQTGPFVSFREHASHTTPKREVSTNAIAVYEFHDGKITRAWYYLASK